LGAKTKNPMTPSSLLLTELKESVRLSKQIRKLIEEQVTAVQADLPKLDPLARLDAMTKLADLLPALNKSIEQAAKHIGVAKNTGTEEVDVEKILAEEIMG
jgi:hypothetical protein